MQISGGGLVRVLGKLAKIVAEALGIYAAEKGLEKYENSKNK